MTRYSVSCIVLGPWSYLIFAPANIKKDTELLEDFINLDKKELNFDDNYNDNTL